MEILKNSLWQIEEFDGIDSGLYRVIHIFDDLSCIALFPIKESKSLYRPLVIDFNLFQSEIASHSILESEFILPPHMLVSEEELSEEHIRKRNVNFKLIEGIVYDLDFLFDYATKKRVPTLASYAKEKSTYHKNIARLLNLYWRYGQDKNAFLPAYQNSGGIGKERKATGKALGAPKVPRTLAVERSKTYKLEDIDKNNFRKSLKKHHLKPHGKNLRETYKELLRTYYFDEVKIANALGKAPYVPSYKQLTSWKKKLFQPENIIKSSTTERDYLLNKRGLLGSSKDSWTVPGSCFEIDATVADVHLVSGFGKQYVLGRPTIYSIVDRASGLVVGLNVSLYHASWRAARQTMANAFLPKSSYCKEFGIDIQESDWPVAHIPLRLMCDNGEMIGLQPQKLVVPLTELQLSPPYRPDFKAMVERSFGLLNKEIIHQLLGTTRGGKVIRGDKDPRKDAVYTLQEFTGLLIEAVLELNRTTRTSLARSSALLIQRNLAPTPLNFWKIHLSEHKHALNVADSNDVISRLYPPVKVSMTRDGIEYNGMYYSCERVMKDNLASIARAQGQWQLDGRINENTTNYIYVKFDKNEGFIKCNLLPKSRMLKNQPMHESEFIQDWLDIKKEETPISVESIDARDKRKEIEKKVKSRAKKDDLSFTEKVRNTREHRENEINTTASPVNNTSDLAQQENNPKQAEAKSSEVFYLPRRRPKKGN
ncbi:transposase [Colwellia sp. Bg11-28]|uniref:transposase n=1 Tax=Colwellia sp. Bg11-28 TaxID=2058305 RepID=UPI000C32F075|nr:transposase [Colwellia sp. Bg11-28]PKH88311.1 transposase [Colwellia sp. Bg11-28]